jgi:hypothetical protein
MENLLSDRQMSDFVTAGFVVLEPSEAESPAALHQKLFESALKLSDSATRAAKFEKTPTHLTHNGDNLLARIPLLKRVLDSPTLIGATTSILGPNYALHPHHFVHRAGLNDQGWHQDGNMPWNSRGNIRSHRPVGALLFYYPQTVTLDMGPTEVLPGTQYFNGSFEDDEAIVHDDDRLDRTFDPAASVDKDLARRDRRLASALQLLPYPVERKKLTVKAGTMVLVHHDILHRGTRQALEKPRFLYKFTLLRTEEPKVATWNHGGGTLDVTGLRPDLAQTSTRIWNWLCGKPGPSASSDEIARLASELLSPVESIRRYAGHELSWLGSSAVPLILPTINNPNPAVRRMACFSLGESRSSNPLSITALVSALTDTDELVRSNAAFALGTLARVTPLGAAAIDALISRLDKAKESDNVFNAFIPRSTVRQATAGAMINVCANHGLSTQQALEFAEKGLADTDRYVVGFTMVALPMLARKEHGWIGKLVDSLVGRVFWTAPDVGEGVDGSFWPKGRARM